MAQAERDLAEGRGAVNRQCELELERDGHDATRAHAQKAQDPLAYGPL
jgi:hypothetical protein